MVSPLRDDERTEADHALRNDDLKRELGVAISYLLLAGINGLFGSGVESGRRGPLRSFSAKHAPPPGWRSVPRDGAALHD